MNKIRQYFRFNNFIIQWHITSRCNWSCLHCYREDRMVEDLSFEDLKYMLKQYVEFAAIFKINYIRLNIGGGEPFMRKDFFRLLQFINKQRNIYVGILSNGSFIDKTTARNLAKLEVVRSIQLSLEGMEDINDRIRGRGAFQKTMAAVENLNRYHIPVRISMTVSRLNVKEMSLLAEFVKKEGVKGMGIRRYVPLGEGKQIEKYMLNAQETREYYIARERIRNRLNEKGRFFISYGCEDGILAQLFSSRKHETKRGIYERRCAVMDRRIVTISAGGDFLLCRRLPIRIGNIFKEDFAHIYFTSTAYDELKAEENQSPICLRCPYFNECLGGAKCIAFAVTGNLFAPDPQCWRIKGNA